MAGKRPGSMSFFEALEAAAAVKGGPICVGIDPRVEPGPDSFDKLSDYGRRVADACAPYAAAFKPQLAFFEEHGPAGWDALNRILEHIQSIDPNYPVILDAKRGDIGSTAEAYARALLDRPGVLAVTLSPYLGRESARPFLAWKNCGLFVLCRTTNPGAERLQERRLEPTGEPFYTAVAKEFLEWEEGRGSVGLVVAGNDSRGLSAVRQRHPDAWFLCPGIGAQGGRSDEAIAAGARSDGLGVLVSASRSVADADNPADAARRLRDSVDAAREQFQKQPGNSALSGLEKNEKESKAEKEALLSGLYRVGAFQTGRFTLKSGKISPFYIDIRRVGADSDLLALCGRAYARMLSGLSAQHVAGIPVAALPLAAAASLSAGMSLIYPRLEKKAHGSGAKVEGVWNKGDRVVLLDDLITTGGSKREAASVLREAGLVVEDLVVLIERGAGGRQDMTNAGIRLHSFAAIEDLLEVGLKKDFLDSQTAQDIKTYVQG